MLVHGDTPANIFLNIIYCISTLIKLSDVFVIFMTAQCILKILTRGIVIWL